MTSSRYKLRGVSASKEDVHKAIKNLSKGLFKNSFCKVLPDVLTNNEKYCLVMHADTAGTKTSLCYTYWRELNDISVWQDIMQDAIVMNIDDLACVGICDNIVISNTIGRNKNLIPGKILNIIISSIGEFISKMKKYNINIFLAGGETADVGDIVRTIDIGVTAFSRIERKNIITNNIKSDDVIIGLSSFGQSTYENSYNSGIGSNGLTSARHDMFSNDLAEKYPESFNPNISKELVYCGSKKLGDIDEDTGITYGKLLLSPTRTFLPVIKNILDKYFNEINGIIHCTGGGQTKVLNFIENIHVIKNNLFETPKIFKIIQENSATSWKEMYKVFNMGHRIELYVNQSIASSIIKIANSFDIEAQVIGKCESYNGKKITINSQYGNFTY